MKRQKTREFKCGTTRRDASDQLRSQYIFNFVIHKFVYSNASSALFIRNNRFSELGATSDKTPQDMRARSCDEAGLN